MINYNTAIVLAGTALVGASAGMIGSLAVLRRKALVGDALAHAALPGLCVAFLVVGARDVPAMLAGAFVSGVVGVAVVGFLRARTRIKEDAAVGVVLSVFFGVGVVLSRLIQNRSTEGSKAGLDSFILGKTSGMIASDLYFIGGAALVVLATLVLLYKEVQLVTFDPALARTQGWPAAAIDFLLMGLVAATVVVGLPAVGAVLVAALLIIPGAAARFWTDRLDHMLVVSALIGGTVGLVGTAISAQASSLPTGPIIVLVGTAALLVSVLFALRRGAAARWLAQGEAARAAVERRLLATIVELEGDSPAPTRPAFTRADAERSLAIVAGVSPRALAQALSRLEQAGDLEAAPPEGYRLTAAGRARALASARAGEAGDFETSGEAP